MRPGRDEEFLFEPLTVSERADARRISIPNGAGTILAGVVILAIVALIIRLVF